MATNTPGSVARQDPRNVSNTIRATMNFGDAGVLTGVNLGTLPKGAFIVGTFVDVSVGFTAATTLQIGTDGPVTNILAATAVTAVAPLVAPTAKLGRIHAAAADSVVTAKLAGSVPIVGTLDIVIEFEGGFPG